MIERERTTKEELANLPKLPLRVLDKCIEEFTVFNTLLMRTAPEGYKPWYFPVEKNGKNPDGLAISNAAPDKSPCCNQDWIVVERGKSKVTICQKCEVGKGSWKSVYAQLSFEQALDRIKKGGNVGISARNNDPLVIIDIDNYNKLEDAPKDTLIASSRKRCGVHCYGWTIDKSLKLNIPTEDGEMRSDDQYVLAPGSFVQFNLNMKKDVEDFFKLPLDAQKDKFLGHYTVKIDRPARDFKIEDVPIFMREKLATNTAFNAHVEDEKAYKDKNGKKGKYTDLFNLKVSDIIGQLPPTARVGHPLHESDTDKNFSLSADGKYGNCWRHMVSLNAVQFLCVKSGYAKCEDAGKPHNGRGYSKLQGDKAAFEQAYKVAVEEGYIEEYVGMPTRTLIPKILLPHGNKLVGEFAEELGNYLNKDNKLFFRRTEDAATLLYDVPLDKEESKKILGFHKITPLEFVSYIERYVRPGYMVLVQKGEITTTEFVHKSITVGASAVVLTSTQFKYCLPIIENIYHVPMPFYRNNELSFTKKGYDERYWCWLDVKSPEIDENMNLSEAVAIIKEIYADFCFEKEQDKTNAIAGLLTPFCRGLYTRITCRTPVFFYKANRERAGKDYCAEITGIIYQGVANSEPPLSDSKQTYDDEFRKKILAYFKMGKARVHFSNNKGYLNSAQLESLTTTEFFTDRELGVNNALTFANILEISLSANTEITYTPDLANRSVFINLFLEDEDPNKRKFSKPDLHGWVKDNRSKILSALYTLIKDWANKGMKPGETPFSSFPEWARVVGGIMTNAELGDPCVPNSDILNIGGDTESKDMKLLWEMLQDEPQFQGKRFTTGALIEKISTDPAYRDLFPALDWNSAGAGKKFGVLWRKYTGRVFGNLKLLMYDHVRNERREYELKTLSNLKNPIMQLISVIKENYETKKQHSIPIDVLHEKLKVQFPLSDWSDETFEKVLNGLLSCGDLVSHRSNEVRLNE